MPKQQRLNEIIAILAERFPNAFAVSQDARLPLKVGIHHDLAAALGETVERKALRAALRYYVQSIGYLKAQKVGSARIDLDGIPAGTVTADEAASAQQRLAAIAAEVRKSKLSGVEPKDEQPPQIEPPKPRRLGLADLRAAGLKRKAQAAT